MPERERECSAIERDGKMLYLCKKRNEKYFHSLDSAAATALHLNSSRLDSSFSSSCKIKTAWRKKCNTSNGARGEGRQRSGGLPDNDGNDNVAA